MPENMPSLTDSEMVTATPEGKHEKLSEMTEKIEAPENTEGGKDKGIAETMEAEQRQHAESKTEALLTRLCKAVEALSSKVTEGNAVQGLVLESLESAEYHQKVIKEKAINGELRQCRDSGDPGNKRARIASRT